MISQLTQRLIDALRLLPGVGEKTAQRMAFQLLAPDNHSRALTLAQSLKHAIEEVRLCEQCRNYTDRTHCELCENQQRDPHLLCIVESPIDVMAFENSASYRGYYFVLHGRLSPLDGLGPQQLGIPQLMTRLSTDITEVIIATSSTAEGRATAHYLQQQLQKTSIRCSRIAFGVPMGGELEYLDSGTLAHALQSRTLFSASDSNS